GPPRSADTRPGDTPRQLFGGTRHKRVGLPTIDTAATQSPYGVLFTKTRQGHRSYAPTTGGTEIAADRGPPDRGGAKPHASVH
ncbi:Hypothetical predicted protein, partial [Pelobates cultripes]